MLCARRQAVQHEVVPVGLLTSSRRAHTQRAALRGKGRDAGGGKAQWKEQRARKVGEGRSREGERGQRRLEREGCTERAMERAGAKGGDAGDGCRGNAGDGCRRRVQEGWFETGRHGMDKAEAIFYCSPSHICFQLPGIRGS